MGIKLGLIKCSNRIRLTCMVSKTNLEIISDWGQNKGTSGIGIHNQIKIINTIPTKVILDIKKIIISKSSKTCLIAYKSKIKMCGKGIQILKRYQ